MLSDNMNKEAFIREIENSLTGIYATMAEPSSYNRFHINRVKDFIAKRPAYYNESETERRFNNANWPLKERLEWIATEFANMYWTAATVRQDYDEKEAMFKKEITSIEKALLWCEIAEVQLVPKGLMTPAFNVKEPMENRQQ